MLYERGEPSNISSCSQAVRLPTKSSKLTLAEPLDPEVASTLTTDSTKINKAAKSE